MNISHIVAIGSIALVSSILTAQAQSLPTGGAPYSILKKNSSTNYDVGWYGPDIFNVKDYGAVGSASSPNPTADTSGFNAAIAAINAAGAGKLYIPAGVYVPSSNLTTITVPVWIYGDGENVSVVNFTSSTGFTVNYSGQSSHICMTVSNLTLANNSGSVSGYGIQYEAGTSMSDLQPPYVIRDLYLSGWSIGIFIDNPSAPGPSGGTIENVNILGNASTPGSCVGIEIENAEGTTLVQNFNIYWCWIAVNLVGSDAGVFIDNFTIAACQWGIDYQSSISGDYNDIVIKNGWISINDSSGTGIFMGDSYHTIGYVTIGDVNFDCSYGYTMIELYCSNSCIHDVQSHGGTWNNGIILLGNTNNTTVHDCNIIDVPSGTGLWLTSSTSNCNVHDMIYQSCGANCYNQGSNNTIQSP